MTQENEAKRDALKRWYLDNGHSNIEFMRDVMECRRLNSFPDIDRAIEFLYDEHKAMGNIKV